MGLELYAGSLYLQQPIGRDLQVYYRVEDILIRKKSKYQEIVVLKLAIFGKALVLDGLIQSTEKDEHVYHEALVHPALTSHRNPTRVLILGGGEGATLREVLKHSTVREAIMVDIDAEVIEVAKKYLPEWHQGAFEDPRSKIVIMDAFEYVEKALSSGETFDVVIMDLTDPYGPEIAKHLYSSRFLEKLNKLIREDGIVVTQAGNSFFYEKQYSSLLEEFKKVFPVVIEYGAWIPSFLYVNNFVMGVNDKSIVDLEKDVIEKRLIERNVKTKFYNPLTHISMMFSPNF